MNQRIIGAMCAAVFALCGVASAAQEKGPKTVTCGGRLRDVANATHAKLNACVVKRGSVVVETTYYQNASKIGGTALAAYPEANVRIGIMPGVELFMDAPSDVAKSGTNGAGIFYFTHPGIGLKAQLFRTNTSAYSIAVETLPPLDAMAHVSLLPQYNVALSGEWLVAPRLVVGLQAGALEFRQRDMGQDHTMAATFATSASFDFTQATAVSAQLQSYSIAAFGSSAQSSGTLGVSQQLGKRALFRVELGTAFNSAGKSKAHYLGFGLTVR